MGPLKALRVWSSAALLGLVLVCVGCQKHAEAPVSLASAQPVPAEAATPAPAPSDGADLVDTAQRLMRTGQRRKARVYALRANSVLQAWAAQSGQFDPLRDAAVAGQLTDLLADLGQYDDAVALTRLQAPGDQEPDLLRLVLHLIDAKDPRGVAKLAPVASQLFASSPASALEGASDLAEMVRRLAIAGFRSAAHEADHALDPRRGLLPVWQRLRLQADLGDPDGAIAAANRLGPLTQPISPMAGVLAAAMAPLSHPGRIDAAGALPGGQARAGAPAQTSAPRADALAAIATDLAEAGHIEAALRAVGPLEAAPPEAVADSRDYALAAIAGAQAKAGRMSAARATARRIYQPAVRAEAMRTLAPAGPG